MRKLCITLFILLFASSAYAGKMKVVSTYPYIASIVDHIGGDRVRVNALARGDFDPHTVIPKPSFISKLRKADVLIINGAQLEIGWLPPLLKQSNNPAVNPGSSGFLDLSTHVKLIDVPKSISREQGDIHPDGNPHYYLNPHNIPLLAKAISEKLSECDSRNSSYYKSNCRNFITMWNQKTSQWDSKLAALKGKQVIEYHKNYDYLLRYYSISLAGTIEPLPGIPPTSKHIESLEKMISSRNISFILMDVYNPDEAGRHLSKKYGITFVKLPHDIGAVPEANDIVSLFDEIVRRLTK